MIFYFIELFRRILLILGLFVASWCMFFPEGILIVVKDVDFENAYKSPSNYLRSSESFEEFVEDRTRDRNIEVNEEVWFEFKALSDQSSLLSDKSRSEGIWILQPDALSGYSWEWPSFVYLKREGFEEYVSVSRKHSSEIYALDSSIKYPNRASISYILVFTLLSYLILPRKKVHQALIYRRMGSVIIPDFLGSLGATFFFSLSLLILMENNPADTLWEAAEGWEALLVVMWLMASIFLLMLVIAQRYANLSIEIKEDALLIHRGLSCDYYPWSGMAFCTDYEGKKGRVLGFLLILFARSPGQVGQGLLVALNEECGIEIHNKRGKSLRIMANHFPRFNEIVEELERRQIAFK